MRTHTFSLAIVSAAMVVAAPMLHAQTIALSSLLTEMSDREAVARFPEPGYQSLPASSFNRAIA